MGKLVYFDIENLQTAIIHYDKIDLKYKDIED